MDAAYYIETSRLEEEHWWYIARRRILEHVLTSLELPPGTRILEAGCGTGGNLELLSRFGALEAFELDASAREFASRRGITDVREGALPDRLPFDEGSFDLIAMLDVLEHIEDDLSALQALSTRLKPGGTLLLTVPAYQFLWSRHDVINHHWRRYHLAPLRGLVERAGYTVTYATYFNTVLFPAVLAVRMYHNAAGKEPGHDFVMPSPAVNRLLTGVFASERHAMPALSLPFGSSILLTARA